MAKVLSLIIVLLGLTCLAAAGKCRPKGCQITFDSYDNARYHAVLKTNDDVVSEPFGISRMTLKGNCKCTLTLWSKSNLDGDSQVWTGGEDSFNTSDVWDQENASFDINCNF